MERAATTASSLDAEHDSGNINRTQSMATLNESFPQGTDSGSGPRGYTLGSGEDNMKLLYLMELGTKLSDLNLNQASLHQMANLDFCDTGNGYSLKDKNEVKTDKTEHRNGMSVKSKNKSQPKKATEKSTVKDEAKTKKS
ncbi:hypothetical protein Tco_0576811 [Tanacetum coccineum]